MLNYIGATSVR